MLKAAREAKLQTTWVANNREFEDALMEFVARTMEHAPFVKDVEQFVERVKYAGRVNSLAQTLIKHTAPGVPDVYQGSEIWDLSLVDPDNRRPVNYEFRRRLFDEMRGMIGENVAARVMERMDDGMPKMWVIHQALQLRHERPELFSADAAYMPLVVGGGRSDNVIAYMRSNAVATIVPRLTMKVMDAWRDTTVVLPEGTWTNRLTGAAMNGGAVQMRSLAREFPVALLVREGVAPNA
jgi:(1->4)-alpha-D-glucan 1-alpha-D-glucosylmutase